MDTDRDLLFTLLAFQQGALDEDRLVQTLKDRPGNATLSLADQLVDQEWLTVDQKATLDIALEETLATNKGDLEGTFAAVIDGKCLEALRHAGLVDRDLDAKLAPAHAPARPVVIGSLGPEPAESRERYTLTHLYAKGGMGQVWLAHDPALGREIALKELRPDQSDNSTVCSRFMTEAQVTAQLEHPGIVPVYEMGKGTLPYYTMRFVKGGTLSQATRNYHKERAAGTADPVGLVKLLGAFVGVCNAIDYAHSRGFIHRDLKGQNIVMGDFGEVIVLDWGLAKRVEPAASPVPAHAPETGPEVTIAETHSPNGTAQAQDDAPRLGSASHPVSGPASHPRMEIDLEPERTMKGQVLGTPAYMAPEQAEGKQHETDARTDVYGLGAILYEILTGQPPFHGKTTKELLKKVCRELPTPPRQINPAVAAPLQAICLKALSKSPAERYGSAGDLAQEVQRYLADEPVQAYPEPWTSHATRWARKHRTIVATAAGLLLTATAALSIGTVLISRERNEAQLQGTQARQAVNDMYTKVAENWLEDRIDPLQKEFLQKTLAYYEKFTAHVADTKAVRLEHGMVYEHMGEIHRKLGRSDLAEQAFDKAVGLLQPLAAESPADREVGRALALTQLRMGDLQLRGNRLDRAETFLNAAAQRLEPLVAKPPAAAPDRTLLARALGSKAELLRRKGESTAAKPLAQRACTLLEKVLKEDPKEAEVRSDLAQANDFLGRVARELGETKIQEQAYQRAYELLDPLVAQFPTVPRYREAMSLICNGLGILEYESGRLVESEAHWQRQASETERLVHDFPDRPEYQRLLAGACSNLGGLLADQDHFEKAEPFLRRGIKLNTDLAKVFPDDREIDFDLANCYQNLGYLLLKWGHPAESLAAHDQAAKINRSLVTKHPKPRCRRNQALVLRCRGESLEAHAQPGAEEAYREAVTLLEKLTGEHPAHYLYQLDLARCLNKLGLQMANARHFDDAEGLFQRALAALSSKSVQQWPLECRREKAMTLSNLGGFRKDASRPNAEEPLRSSVAIAQELASNKQATAKDRQFLAVARNNLGDALLAQGRYEEASKECQEALTGFEAIVAENPRTVQDRYFLAYVYEQQGQLLAKLKKPAEAKLAMEKAVARQKEALKLSDGKYLASRDALAGHLTQLADLCLALADFDGVVQSAVELSRATLDSGQGCLHAAKILARCAGRVQLDKTISAQRKDELSRKLLGRTVVLLREAVDADAKLAEEIRKDEVFKELRDRPEFQAMLGSVVDLGHGKRP